MRIQEWGFEIWDSTYQIVGQVCSSKIASDLKDELIIWAKVTCSVSRDLIIEIGECLSAIHKTSQSIDKYIEQTPVSYPLMILKSTAIQKLIFQQETSTVLTQVVAKDALDRVSKYFGGVEAFVGESVGAQRTILYVTGTLAEMQLKSYITDIICDLTKKLLKNQENIDDTVLYRFRI